MVVNKMILYEPQTNKTELTLTTMVDTVFKLEQFYNQRQYNTIIMIIILINKQ